MYSYLAYWLLLHAAFPWNWRNLNSYPKQFLSDQYLISYKEPIEVPRVHLTSYRPDLFYWQRLPLVDKDWIGSPIGWTQLFLPFAISHAFHGQWLIGRSKFELWCALSDTLKALPNRCHLFLTRAKIIPFVLSWDYHHTPFIIPFNSFRH